MSDPTDLPWRGACPCGAFSFETHAFARTRLICHCTICQAFTGRDVSDVVLLPATKIRLTNPKGIAFHKYKRWRLPPPNLDRGRCARCGHPVVEVGGVGPFKILFIPAASFASPNRLPPVQAHLFYEHRQRDAEDGIAKHEGYLASVRSLASLILQAMIPPVDRQG